MSINFTNFTNIIVSHRFRYRKYPLPKCNTLFIQDQGFPSRWTVTTLHVQLVDVNDAPPEFLIHRQERIVNENTPIGPSVCEVSAVDGAATDSVKADIRYMIVGGKYRI